MLPIARFLRKAGSTICKNVRAYPATSSEMLVDSGTSRPTVPTRPETWCLYYDRPTVEQIESTSVLLFPGQGSQFVGMAKQLIAVPGVGEMFEKANSIFKTNLLRLCTEGPASELMKTINCQPAVYVTGLAAVEKLKINSPDLLEKCVAVAGYSIGEISALVFAGAYTFEEGLDIVRVRAENMQRASDLFPSGMCSVRFSKEANLRFALSAAVKHCKDDLKMETPVVCQAASFISPDCTIIAGNIEALAFVESNAPKFDLSAVTRLPVAGAFHTPLMMPAVEPFKEAVKNMRQARTPAIPVISNVDAEPHGQGSSVARRLVKQLTRPLLWEQTLHALFSRPPEIPFPRIIEVGPGRSLGKSLKLVDERAFKRYQAVEV